MKISLWLSALLVLLSVRFTNAGSATWNVSPTSDEWTDPTNWTPATVPNGPHDTATFDSSNTFNILISRSIGVDAIVFNPGADTYLIATNHDLTLSGAGVVNNSGFVQLFAILTTVGKIHFRNSASAGENVHYSVRAGAGETTELSFYNTATAGGAIINNNSGDLPGATLFFDSSTAGNATITNHAGSPNGGACAFMGNSNAGAATFFCVGQGSGNTGVQFRSHSSAAHGTFSIEGGNYLDLLDHSRGDRATIILNGGEGIRAEGGTIYCADASHVDNATLIANSGIEGGRGGAIYLLEESSGDKARVELAPGTVLSIQSHVAPGVGLGSIEGAGQVTLGANNLAVGENDLDTIFSGRIEDGTTAGGSLTKVGTGSLALSGANTYSGGTIVTDGTFLVQNATGSATGTGPVSVQAGRLSGNGIISDAVTVGNGDSITATISPGRTPANPDTLTVQSVIYFAPDGSYQFNLQSEVGTSAALSANGVSIDSNALFASHDSGRAALPSGTSFVVIDNTAATAISGTFSNLPDGGTIVVANNTFEANYEGGDGNDLMLTVVQ